MGKAILSKKNKPESLRPLDFKSCDKAATGVKIV